MIGIIISLNYEKMVPVLVPEEIHISKFVIRIKSVEIIIKIIEIINISCDQIKLQSTGLK